MSNFEFIAGIRFQPVGKIYHFDVTGVEDLELGDFVVVETSRGIQIGEVITMDEITEETPQGNWKPIQRKATPQDLVIKQKLENQALAYLIACREKSHEMIFNGLKLVHAEFDLDGQKLTVLYGTDSDKDMDISRIFKSLKSEYPDVQPEARRIGPRDVAKFVSGMGACGIEQLCCSRFLTDFSPISIRMAKAQRVSLDPSEITGMCGRLRCCMIYEYEGYAEANKRLPKMKKRVITPMGEGKVIDLIPLSETVVVRLDHGDTPRAEFHVDDLEPWNEFVAKRREEERLEEENQEDDDRLTEYEEDFSPDDDSMNIFEEES